MRLVAQPKEVLAAAVVAFSLLLIAVPQAPAGSLGDPVATPDRHKAPRSAWFGPTTVAAKAPAFEPREVIVKFKAGVSAQQRADTRREQNADVERTLPIPGVQLLELPRGADVRDVVAELEAQPEVEYAQPNHTRRALGLPNDPRLRDLWGLHNTGQTVAPNTHGGDGGGAGTPDADIDAPEAWDLTTGSDDVTVAIVDTGIADDHPALQGNLWRNPGETGGGRESNGHDDDGNGYVDDVSGWDFADDDGNPDDLEEHGTHVAGTVGARGNNGADIVGVNWNVKLMAVRVLGRGGGSDADIAEGFVYAARNGAKIANASLGGPGDSPVIDDAVGRNPNTLYVVAAGNDGSNNDIRATTPCVSSRPNLVCVAASDQNDRLTDFSNYGRSSVDLAAPGQAVLSSTPHHDTKLDAPFQDGAGNASGPGWQTIPSGRWGFSDAYGPWSVAESPGLCWAGLIETGCYRANDDSTLRTPGIDLRDCRGGSAHMTWETAAEIEDLENGQLTDYLEVLAKSSTSGEAFHKGYLYGDFKFDPKSITTDLSQLEGHAAFVDFHFHSDAFNPGNAKYDGVYIDNVKVRCRTSAYDAGDYQSFPGTSMASPHVAGAAALVWARRPNATVAQVREALLSSVDKKPDLTSAVETGGRLNARGALDAIDRMLPETRQVGNPSPAPPQPQPPVNPPANPPVGPTKPPANTPVRKPRKGECSKLKGKKRSACVKKACGRLKGKQKKACVKLVTTKKKSKRRR